MSKRPLFSTTLLILSVCLYAASLANICYYTGAEAPSAPGWGLLLIGWVAVLGGMIAWLANPLLLVGWAMLACRLKRLAAVLAIAALACGSSFMLYQTMWINEAGTEAPISGYGPGYWLWLASAATLFVASLVAMLESRFQAPKQAADTAIPPVV